MSKESEIEKIELLIMDSLFEWEENKTELLKQGYLRRTYVTKKLTDKFRIIPKTDPPEKHVEYYLKPTNKPNSLFPNKYAEIKLKWRGEK